MKNRRRTVGGTAATTGATTGAGANTTRSRSTTTTTTTTRTTAGGAPTRRGGCARRNRTRSAAGPTSSRRGRPRGRSPRRRCGLENLFLEGGLTSPNRDCFFSLGMARRRPISVAIGAHCAPNIVYMPKIYGDPHVGRGREEREARGRRRFRCGEGQGRPCAIHKPPEQCGGFRIPKAYQ